MSNNQEKSWFEDLLTTIGFYALAFIVCVIFPPIIPIVIIGGLIGKFMRSIKGK